ncbi:MULTISPECIES: hypothetical protein [unclassified Pseudomonas]|uniref:hypothetical protein n=1 Tax=unclassified Pseudomonas TaxID=196821 RepID=UPI000AE26834|nr:MULTISPECIES: hypothetical protein [unclassified Pseudomonas]MBV7476997.1 hypothetical protein [Pseudomonas sp. PDM31]
MNPLRRMKWRRKVLAIAVAALLIMAVMRALSDKPEIALVIDEPWEAMRLRSSAAIDPDFPGYSWFSTPKSDARLHFIDDQLGFLTPLARFFTVSFDRNGLVRSLRMSPQIEPLLLDVPQRSAIS